MNASEIISGLTQWVSERPKTVHALIVHLDRLLRACHGAIDGLHAWICRALL